MTNAKGRPNRKAPSPGRLARRLGKRLRELRGNKSLEVFAEELGISKSSLGRIERGEQNVLMGTLQLMCDRLGLDVGALFARD